jgi:hypothetical protein
MKTLVIGATGTAGSVVGRAVVNCAASVHALVDKHRTLPQEF